jgi:two-component system alkaline phosphatase synthesis response regulator PhoP
MTSKHILVVEDEEHLAIGIRYNLEAEGYQVTTVGDGREALQLLKGEQIAFDLIILDIMLPGMSGYDVCESLRAAGHDIPVMILSARTLAEDRTRGFDVGADQYMTKPFDLDELLSRVKSLLKAYSLRTSNGVVERTATNEFEFGDAHINFETFEVTVHGEAIRMTQLEMSLLRYFVDNEGRVIPRHELLENVWKMPGYISTRAPDQFLRRLRKTFEPDPSSPKHFLTLRDAGYRFVADPG